MRHRDALAAVLETISSYGEQTTPPAKRALGARIVQSADLQRNDPMTPSARVREAAALAEIVRSRADASADVGPHDDVRESLAEWLRDAQVANGARGAAGAGPPDEVNTAAASSLAHLAACVRAAKAGVCSWLMSSDEPLPGFVEDLLAPDKLSEVRNEACPGHRSLAHLIALQSRNAVSPAAMPPPAQLQVVSRIHLAQEPSSLLILEARAVLAVAHARHAELLLPRKDDDDGGYPGNSTDSGTAEAGQLLRVEAEALLGSRYTEAVAGTAIVARLRELVQTGT